jgi:hypothetical protein
MHQHFHEYLISALRRLGMTLLRRFSGGVGREPHKNGIYRKKSMKLRSLALGRML